MGQRNAGPRDHYSVVSHRISSAGESGTRHAAAVRGQGDTGRVKSACETCGWSCRTRQCNGSRTCTYVEVSDVVGDRCAIAQRATHPVHGHRVGSTDRSGACQSRGAGGCRAGQIDEGWAQSASDTCGRSGRVRQGHCSGEPINASHVNRRICWSIDLDGYCSRIGSDRKAH